MKRFQFRIGWFMTAVVFLSVGFAALQAPTILWASLIFTTMAAAMLTAALAACLRRGTARAAWGGYALFCGFYFAATFGPLPNGSGVSIPPMPPSLLHDFTVLKNPSDQGAWGDAPTPSIPDMRPLQEPMLRSARQGSIDTASRGFAGVTTQQRNWIQLRRIIHSFGAIGFGLIGAWIGSRLTLGDRAGQGAPAPLRS